MVTDFTNAYEHKINILRAQLETKPHPDVVNKIRVNLGYTKLCVATLEEIVKRLPRLKAKHKEGIKYFNEKQVQHKQQVERAFEQLAKIRNAIMYDSVSDNVDLLVQAHSVFNDTFIQNETILEEYVNSVLDSNIEKLVSEYVWFQTILPDSSIFTNHPFPKLLFRKSSSSFSPS